MSLTKNIATMLAGYAQGKMLHKQRQEELAVEQQKLALAQNKEAQNDAETKWWRERQVENWGKDDARQSADVAARLKSGEDTKKRAAALGFLKERMYRTQNPNEAWQRAFRSAYDKLNMGANVEDVPELGTFMTGSTEFADLGKQITEQQTVYDQKAEAMKQLLTQAGAGQNQPIPSPQSLDMFRPNDVSAPLHALSNYAEGKQAGRAAEAQVPQTQAEMDAANTQLGYLKRKQADTPYAEELGMTKYQDKMSGLAERKFTEEQAYNLLRNAKTRVEYNAAVQQLRIDDEANKRANTASGLATIRGNLEIANVKSMMKYRELDFNLKEKNAENAEKRAKIEADKSYVTTVEASTQASKAMNDYKEIQKRFNDFVALEIPETGKRIGEQQTQVDTLQAMLTTAKSDADYWAKVAAAAKKSKEGRVRPFDVVKNALPPPTSKTTPTGKFTPLPPLIVNPSGLTGGNPAAVQQAAAKAKAAATKKAKEAEAKAAKEAAIRAARAKKLGVNP